MDKQRKKELQRQYAEQQRAKARTTLRLSQKQHTQLLDYLDARLLESGCDHSHRHTRIWLESQNLPTEEVLE